MKNLLKTFVFAAFAAFSFASCEVEPVETPNNNEGQYLYNFSIASADESTKTTLDGTTLKWENSDKLGFFAEGTKNAFGNIATLTPKVLIPVYLNAALSTDGVVYAYFPFSSNATSAQSIPFSIPSIQTGDMDANPLISLPYVVTDDFIKGRTNVNDMLFCNLGSVILFKVYSSVEAYRSETINSITFESASNIAGNFTLDATAVDYADPSTLAPASISNGSNTISLSCAPSIGSSVETAGEACMVVIPGSYAGTVTVTTDAATYSYSFTTPKDFNRSSIKPLNVDLGKTGARSAAQLIRFNKVTSEPSDYSGVYLLVSEDYGIALDGSQPSSEMHKAANMLQVSPTDGVIECNASLINSAITIEKYEGGYSLLTLGADYIGHTSTSNTGIQGSKDPILNNIVWDNGHVKISSTVSSTKYTIAANPNPTSNVNDPLINYYKTVASTYKGISLYKYDDGITDLEFGSENDDWSIVLNDANKCVDVDWLEVEHAAKYILSCTGQENVEIAAGEGVYERNLTLAEGQYEISITAVPEDETLYRAATVSKTISVPDYREDLSFGTGWTIEYNNSTNVVYVEWQEVQNASKYIYSFSGEADVEINAGQESYHRDYTNLGEGEYVISIKAIPSDPTLYRETTISKTVVVPSMESILVFDDIDVGSGAIENPVCLIPSQMNRINIWTVDGLYDDQELTIASDATWLSFVDGNYYTVAANTGAERTVYVKINYYGLSCGDAVTSFKFTQASGLPVDVTVFSEDFSDITVGNSTASTGSSTAWEGNSNFSSVKTAYKAGGAVRLGSGSNTGLVTTKSLDLSSKFTVTLDVKGWTTHEGDIKITCGSQSKTISYNAVMSGDFETISADFSAETNASQVTIATTSKRAFIDNIVIVRH